MESVPVPPVPALVPVAARAPAFVPVPVRTPVGGARGSVSRRAVLLGISALTATVGSTVGTASGSAAASSGGTSAAPSAAPSDSPAVAQALLRSELTGRLAAYSRLRADPFGLFLWDYRNASPFSFNAGMRSQTLSTIKLLVAVTLHKLCEEGRRPLTATQQSLCSRMMIHSDNAATNLLVRDHVGLAAMKRVALECQMFDTVVQGGTVAGARDWWGYSMTYPLDLLRLMNIVMLGTTYLSWTSRSNIQWLMSQVTSSQRWGVCDPPLPTSVLTRVKNGWGPYAGGYRLNSVGYVDGGGRRYAMAVLLVAPTGYSHGLATINQVSRIVYDALAAPLL